MKRLFDLLEGPSRAWFERFPGGHFLPRRSAFYTSKCITPAGGDLHLQAAAPRLAARRARLHHRTSGGAARRSLVMHGGGIAPRPAAARTLAQQRRRPATVPRHRAPRLASSPRPAGLHLSRHASPGRGAMHGLVGNGGGASSEVLARRVPAATARLARRRRLAFQAAAPRLAGPRLAASIRSAAAQAASRQ